MCEEDLLLRLGWVLMKKNSHHKKKKNYEGSSWGMKIMGLRLHSYIFVSMILIFYLSFLTYGTT